MNGIASSVIDRLELHYVGSNGGGNYAGPCPWCGGSDRFQFWLNDQKGAPGYWCRQCNKSGNIARHGDPLMTMLNLNSEGQFPVYMERNHIEEYVYQDYVNPTDIMSWCSNPVYYRRIYEYFSTFGLNNETIKKYKLGWAPQHQAMVIPYIARIDEKEYYVGAQLRHTGDVDPKKRYTSVKGSKISGFTHTQLVSIPNFAPGPVLPYLLICESIKDAILLDQMGYYATAFRPSTYWYSKLRTCLCNISNVVIVQDNDGQRGYEIATKFQHECKRQSIRIACPNYKQPTDLYAATRNYDLIENWLDSVGVYKK